MPSLQRIQRCIDTTRLKDLVFRPQHHNRIPRRSLHKAPHGLFQYTQLALTTGVNSFMRVKTRDMSNRTRKRSVIGRGDQSSVSHVNGVMLNDRHSEGMYNAIVRTILRKLVGYSLFEVVEMSIGFGASILSLFRLLCAVVTSDSSGITTTRCNVSRRRGLEIL